MILNIISKDEFNELLLKVESIQTALNNMQQQEKVEGLFNNKEACQKLKISPRTLQNYRDRGLIEFSQVGRKIFYMQKAVNNFIHLNKIN